MTTNTLIIDGDYPMAVGGIDAQRDLTLPVEQARAPAALNSWFKWQNDGIMATLPEMRKGRVAAALVKVAVCVKKPGHPHGEYRTKENAHAAAEDSLHTTSSWKRRTRLPFSIPRRISPLTWKSGRKPPTTTTFPSA